MSPRRALTPAEVEAARGAIERIGRLSDGIIRLGPLKLGWDSVLEFIPGVGEVYSVGAGAWLLLAGYRAHAAGPALAQAAAMVGANTAMGSFNLIPVAGVVGSVVAGLFRGHRYAAKALLRSIDDTLYQTGPRTPEREAQAEAERRRAGKRRVVWLDGEVIEVRATAL